MRFLIVEDDPGMGLVLRHKLASILSRFPEAIVTLVQSLAAAKHEIETYPSPDVVVLDLTLLDATWEETLAEASSFDLRSPVVILTGHPIEKVKALLSNSSIEILAKTPETLAGSGLFQAILRAFNRKAERENLRMKENIAFMKDLINEPYATQTTAIP